MTNTMELWSTIPETKGLYEASNTGHIRRTGHSNILSEAIRKRHSGVNSDALVNLCIDGRPKTYLVSRLIGKTWVSGYSQNMTINHIDGNSMNNHIDNLEWITRAENVQDGHRRGAYSRHKTPCVLIGVDGTRHWFDSKKEANQFLGRRKHYLGVVLEHNNPIRSITGEVYRFENCN